MEKLLPAIPAKRYFTIGEVSDLCGVKPYVLRYWEQEFTQLRPMKRRGNRRYYQHHEVLLIRRIRDLLYDQGFTISGARNQLGDLLASGGRLLPPTDDQLAPTDVAETQADGLHLTGEASNIVAMPALQDMLEIGSAQLRAELLSIRDLLIV